jgi:hypothetical protein
MPPSFASLLAPQTGDGEAVPPLDALPGSADFNARNSLPQRGGGVLNASSGGDGSSQRRRVAVVDGLRGGDAPGDDDFAPAPFPVPNARRKRGRPSGQSDASARRGVVPNASNPSGHSDNPPAGVARRGRRRGAAASQRIVALADGVVPLARHVRRRAELPEAVQRAHDDINDAVDDRSERSVESDGASGSSIDENDDDAVLRNVEEFESSFDANAWVLIAWEGVDSIRAPCGSPTACGGIQSRERTMRK